MRNQLFRRLSAAALIAVSGLALAGSATGQSATYTPPQHTTGFPGLVGGENQAEVAASLALGPELERDRSPKWLLDDQRKLDKSLAALGPQKPGQVDAYVVVVGLDSDPIFGREAREAGKVLSRRYNAVGHTIVLAGTEGSGPSALPNGSPRNLAVALARVAELMDKQQDVVVLYTAGHGAKVGLAYHDGDDGFGIIPPERMARLFDELGIKNRLLILSACFSGIFVPTLSNENTALFTAASADRTSFGCQSDKDWTFYGDAMINHAMREPVPLAKAGEDARTLVAQWEAMGANMGIIPSQPQIAIGSKVDTWLKPLEARMPRTATPMVGRPAITIFTDAPK
ncbi:MAG: peptidase C13 [Sphingomonas sp.]|uniref:C13 family peptidase n=1 Tax=Sphingomonas sp. TaxID=28214 RepID=UPI0011FD7F23|nr:C13 family peptidase [Sphingomonas sp.]THD34856.1 MAG: peptidase C13 [Sphingomonas sp.]